MLWHPGGLEDWDRSDWSNALVGEYFELVQAGWQNTMMWDSSEVRDEWADVMIYALTFDASERGVLGETLDIYRPVKHPFGASRAGAQVTDALGGLTSAVKESCRERDGAASKGHGPERIEAEIAESLTWLAKGLLDFSKFIGFDGLTAVGDKFNRTSEKFGFPQRWIDNERRNK